MQHGFSRCDTSRLVDMSGVGARVYANDTSTKKDNYLIEHGSRFGEEVAISGCDVEEGQTPVLNRNGPNVWPFVFPGSRVDGHGRLLPGWKSPHRLPVSFKPYVLKAVVIVGDVKDANLSSQEKASYGERKFERAWEGLSREISGNPNVSLTAEEALGEIEVHVCDRKSLMLKGVIPWTI